MKVTDSSKSRLLASLKDGRLSLSWTGGSEAFIRPVRVESDTYSEEGLRYVNNAG